MGPLSAIFKSWLPWAIFGASAGALYMGQPLLALAIVTAGFFGALVATVGRTRRHYEGDPLEGLSLDSQARLRPLVRVRNELADLTERHASHPAVKVIGAEAVLEADEIIAKGASLLAARSDLMRTASGNDVARIEDLRAKIEMAEDLIERERLEAALSMATNAADHRERKQAALARIDAQLEECRAALEKLKAEMESALSDHGGTEEDLRMHLSQLQSLGGSLDEANALLKERE